MNLLFVILLLTCSEARKKRPKISAGNVDVYPQTFNQPIDFGHVYRDGYIEHGDEDRDPRDIPNINEIRQRRPKEKAAEGATFISPRDEYEYHRREGDVPRVDVKPGREKMWFDFPAMLERNIKTPNVRMNIATPKNNKRPERDQNMGPEVEDDKRQYFDKNKFSLVNSMRRERSTNWTTCDEFGKGAKFHPADVLDVQWLPFYVWTNRHYPNAYLNQFTRPTQKLVREYREKYGPYLNDKIDWEKPKLFHRFTPLLEQLLIAADQRGLFYVIMPLELPEHVIGTNMQLPVNTLRLKTKNKYLLLMYCDETNRHIAAMAVSGEEPNSDEQKAAIAKSFKIRGDGDAVSRDLDREMYLNRMKNDAIIEKKEKSKGKMIRINQNYGMFPPEDEAKHKDVTAPQDETILEAE